ncbi:hypothetical protein BKG83_23045 [Mycobacteroides chelonae]|jgi:cobalamin synthase|uniref:low affinity iron permease family protein n=1 Tax=Mycobacteroides TaxID=670516 RepID=UPI0007A0FB12|nr:low affinity iron permease family protein [Mycobacteroides chelonae]AMW20016.1 hypothetical protein Chelonae_p2265 [Mycobacterium sp. QIA-37]PKQ55988.1 hypothetical protein B5566_21375 [Mycobacterium sp. MHSD3]SKN73831.1 Predicted small integral membrane protein [Mycobacteroides abscessus subsp. bolletii]AYM42260.1 hypothetical protein DYE20_12500 [[Mycobacterium] chelonae subsp. gwanakae]MBF9521533.1 low affinity iron permease family protein [Mycobacteroides chelonae]
MRSGTHPHGPAVYPSEVNQRLSAFDKFATLMSGYVSQPWFFVMCVLIVVLWAPTFVLFNIDTWQLIINTLTTIITFLLVALLQNTQRRSDNAVQQKLNGIADGLADIADALGQMNPNLARQLSRDRADLLDAVGLEEHESTDSS